MAIVLQVACVLFILAAIIVFVRTNSRARTGSSKPQMALAVYQIVLFGWFFALCVSDVLDISVNFSYVRFVLNIAYAMVFSAVAVYTFAYKNKGEDRYFRCIVWAYIVLTALQCFVFPYETENEIMRIIEAVEGAAVFGFLIALLLKLENKTFCRKILIAMVALELFIAVENLIMPFASITDDFQIVDIPLNYAALFMRPVLFASLALLYQVRLDKKNTLLRQTGY